MAHHLRLGTRGSQLALWQANAVAARIAAVGGPPCEIVVIRTSGDQLQDRPLSEAGGKRLFVKEIEDALLRGEIDLAVHSSKDMPALLPDGLAIAGVLPREDPLDAVVLPQWRSEVRGQRAELEGTSGSLPSDLIPPPSDLIPLPSALTSIETLVAALGQTASIGTSSVRRIAQLTRLLPSARFEAIRGNLDTRLRKLDDRQYDAIVLAAAGLRRLGFASRISLTLPVEACVPAPGQGIVAVEIRDDDVRTRDVIGRISDPMAAAALDAERAVVEALGGGCQTPIGALAVPILAQSTVASGQGHLEQSAVGGRQDQPSDHGRLTTDDCSGVELELIAAVVALDGSRALRAHVRGSIENARLLGKAAGVQLLAEGAGDILAGVERDRAASSEPRVPSHEQ